MRTAVALVVLVAHFLPPTAAACNNGECLLPDQDEPLVPVLCDGDVCISDPKSAIGLVCRALGFPAHPNSCAHAAWCVVKEAGLGREIAGC